MEDAGDLSRGVQQREHYRNKLYTPPGQPDGAMMWRYWVSPYILVGGSIVDAADAEHLAVDFGITHVLSVESERNDLGRLDPFKAAARFAFPDAGHPIPTELTLACIGFYHSMQGDKNKLYLHCQAGGSRSPSMAYALLRSDGDLPAAALRKIRIARGSMDATLWGEHEVHRAYLESIDGVFR